MFQSPFFEKPKLIEDLSNKHFAYYKSEGYQDLNLAINYIDSGKIDKAKALLNKFSSYKKGDVYYPFRRDIALKFSDYFTISQEYTKAIEVIEPLFLDDERDIDLFCAWVIPSLNISSNNNDAQKK